MTTDNEAQGPQQPARSPNRKPAFVIAAVIALLVISFGIFAGTTFLRRRAFIGLASSACQEVSRIDSAFALLVSSPAPERCCILQQTSDATEDIGGLETELQRASVPDDLRGVQASLCQALDQHQKLYEAINCHGEGRGDAAMVKQALESASALYLLVDEQKLPLAKGLPGLSADKVLVGLKNAKDTRPVVAQKPEPPKEPTPTVTPEPAKERPSPETKLEPAAKQPTAPIVAVKLPSPAPAVSRPPSPPRAVHATAGKTPAPVKKQRKTGKQKTVTFRCSYRGCNAWFVKASLLQKHKKYCIYRPGGPAARSRKR